MKIPSLPTLSFALVLTPALATLSFSSAHAQVLLNGSFESPQLVSGTETAGGGTYWNSTGDAHIIANDYMMYGNTPYGVQYLGLNCLATDSQTISGFVAGDTYLIGAHYADVEGYNAKLQISITGAVVDSEVFGIPSGGRYGSGLIDFDSAVVAFTATETGPATITLEDLGGNGLVVDDVSLYSDLSLGSITSAAIPEPSSTALVLLGGFALAGIALRAKRLLRSPVQA